MRHFLPTLSSAIVVVALACSLWAAPGSKTGPAATLPNTAAEMEAAHGAAAAAIKDAILKAAPTIPTARAAYAQALAKEFAATLNSSNSDARLNTAIAFAELKSIPCDRVLVDMLKNTDPSVRYWAARGLEDLAPSLKKVGPKAAVAALHSARTAETSPVVSTQLDLALKAY